MMTIMTKMTIMAIIVVSQMIKEQLIKLTFDQLLFDHYPCFWSFFYRIDQIKYSNDQIRKINLSNFII